MGNSHTDYVRLVAYNSLRLRDNDNSSIFIGYEKR